MSLWWTHKWGYEWFLVVFLDGLWVNFLVGFVGGTWVRFRVVLWKYCAIL
jgi:hypothetical protein